MPVVQSEREPEPGAERLQRWYLGLIAVGVGFVILYQARFLLVPLAIAVLLFSLTSAVIDFITRIRLGRFSMPGWLANAMAVVLISSLLLALYGIISAQIGPVVSTASNYTERAQEAVAALFAWLGDDVAQAVLGAFQDIDIGSYMRAAAGSAGNFLVTTILIILYVGFLFAERPWFETKLENLFTEPEQAANVHRIFASISRSVHHYMLVKTLVSAVTAAIVYAILLIFGLDFAEALAVLTFVLNFIPNIGSIVATALPALVALVQFDSWSGVVLILLTVGTVQFTFGNIVDPLLMGRTLSLSSFAIILSLTFWGAIWGVIGMFLAVPIMVMVMIVCSHIPSLRPLAVMLSRDGLPVTRFGRPDAP